MMCLLKKLWTDDSGATAVEYGLIAGVMAALIFSVLGLFGEKVTDLFNAIGDKLSEATDKVTRD